MPTHYTNCLYIHGLHSNVNLEKISILENYFEKTTARHIVYEENPDSYKVLRKMAMEEKVDFIVGSSFGGYLGFYLSRELQLPAILFNPALFFKNQDDTFITAEIVRKSPFACFVIGEQDDVVPPGSIDSFIRENEVADNIKTIRCNWLAHQIDLQTFDSMIASGIRLSLKQ